MVRFNRIFMTTAVVAACGGFCAMSFAGDDDPKPSKKEAKRKGREGEKAESGPKLPGVGDVLSLQVRECESEARRFGLSVRVEGGEEDRGDYAAYLAHQGQAKASGAKLGSLLKEKLGETLSEAAQSAEKPAEDGKTPA